MDLFRTLKTAVNSACDTLYKNDALLIENATHEVAIAHRFAVYLEHTLRDVFPDHHFDIEYNRYEDQVKQSENGTSIRPDILIHKRMVQNENKLVIEIKKNCNSDVDADDEVKLLELTKHSGSYAYNYGLFMNVKTPTDIDLVWFVDGARMDICESNV
ncbi:MAG: hypothetical protein JW915_10135 [Chitinispirillaceae bacterium]|nr:hypothetical protein [Chitinispirillaceae bacterium]